MKPQGILVSLKRFLQFLQVVRWPNSLPFDVWTKKTHSQFQTLKCHFLVTPVLFRVTVNKEFDKMF